MEYFKLNKYTDWQVMYSPSFWKKDKEYRRQVINKLMNSRSGEEAPVIPCVLIHQYEIYRNSINWEEEGKEEPPLEPPILKDVIQISGMLSFGNGGSRGIIISQKFKNALENYVTDKHFFINFY